MKIGVVGCGALGSYYGAKLGRDGREVHFLLRSDYEAVRRNGVRVRSVEGDFHVQPKCARAAAEIGVCDLVLIGLKTTANHQFPQLLPPLVGANTAVMTLQNGLGNEAQMAALFGPEKILGGLCFVCLNRVEPGVIHHLAHGTIVMGEHQRWPEPRTHELASMFRHAASAAGYDAVAGGVVRPCVAPRPCLPTDRLLADLRWGRLVRELMLEVIAAANALGLRISESVVDKQIERTRTMGAYQASTLIDFERGQPLELESMFLEPLLQARKAGVAAPRLAALCEVLTALDPGQRASHAKSGQFNIPG
ncbi:MAG: 2-dehydropantoate 2-reductase [Verrucomicrobia bacterium]|nr:MAG: 2-dehydropantoate 2-reductase [Verrucomicrobiota bacterium]